MILKIAISGHWANQNEKTTFENSSTLKITNEEISLILGKEKFLQFFRKIRLKVCEVVFYVLSILF